MSLESESTASAGDGGGDRILSVDGVGVSYGKVAALQDVSVSVGEGEVVSVIGPNGAGKTTLAETVSGFHDYDGSVRFEDDEVRSQSVDALVERGLIHCTETRDLFGYMTVEENLTLGSYRRHDDTGERLDYVYDVFPVLDERSEQEAHTMSGGEQQMLAIGRALMGDPELLILDEPTIGLAPVIVQDISAALTEIQESGVTVLLCEQNVTFAVKHADRIYLLENGSVVREGTAESLQGDEYIRDAYLGT
ncbi:ABC transporter ATP-binding protein [Haloarchaeobius sp. DFWS5]|uniref:ABC transporter ATP-binding protein n=1 Tax=Haloarchaeobius sp. DFWS5 TaxID=3446114 RepID=UPI003EBFAD7A